MYMLVEERENTNSRAYSMCIIELKSRQGSLTSAIPPVTLNDAES